MALTTELLLQAYRAGIFPMAKRSSDPEVFWVDPRRRGIIPLDRFHLSRSLARRLRRDDYTVTRNRDFAGVVDACADREETWINDTIRALFIDLHATGQAHSIEVWMDDALAGGVYGITLGGCFCGESMFSYRRDGSKIALAWLVDLLRRGGFTLFDTQFLTPHLESLGGMEITRSAYRTALAAAVEREADFTAVPLAASGHEVVQRITQTS